MFTSTATRSIILFIVGVLLGIYLPGALLYLIRFARQRHFGWKVVVQEILLVVAILLLFLVALALFGGLLEVLYPGAQFPSDLEMALLGYGGTCGFVGGIVLFIVGVRKGRRKGPTMQAPPAHPASLHP